MKLQAFELPNSVRTQIMQMNSKAVLLIALAVLVLLAIIPLYYPLLGYNSSKNFSETSSNDDQHQSKMTTAYEKCDLFTGEWIQNPEAPYYTNATCWAIHEHQNCMKYGRPDTEFMKWRWKPHGCELPIFNPSQFLEIVRGKSMAFVGDSLARNQMQSLICLLSRVEYPIDVSYTPDDSFRRWKYTAYNFTLAAFSTPYLVRSKQIDPIGPTHNGLFNLYLDEYDAEWVTQMEDFDFVVISTGHTFFRPLMYYENRRLIGCTDCRQDNVTDLPTYYGYQKVFDTAFRAISGLENFKGIVFLRTFAPSHFEGGDWNTGGKCLRTRPFGSNETRLEGVHLELFTSQIEEFKRAEKEGRKRGIKFRLLDATKATLLRPDGHPSVYGHWPNENVTLYNDCVHWCLPGPIDSWNDFLLELMKMERSKDRPSE